VGLRPTRRAEKESSNRCVGEPASHVAEGRRLIVVLDTGGVEALAPIDDERRARLDLARREASTIILPAAVLAEGVFSGRPAHDFQVRRLLELVQVAVVDRAVGLSAGALRQHAVAAGMRHAPSAVDAIVIAEADARAHHDDVRVITSDRGDLELLASLAEHSDRLSVLVL
jgi:predicted nucleic acid-binding protein